MKFEELTVVGEESDLRNLIFDLVEYFFISSTNFEN